MCSSRRFNGKVGRRRVCILFQKEISIEDLQAIAKRIIQTIGDTPVHQGHDLKVGISIDIALYPEDSKDLKMLLAHADEAMYTAKQSGKDQFKFYSHTI